MSSAERVAKYLSDAQVLVQAKPINAGKIKSEIAKLATWLSKQQLVTCIQMYYKAGLENPEARDAAFTLITSKSKKQCLKWLEALTGDADAAKPSQPSSDSSLLTVIEAEAGKLTLMEEDSGETVEGVEVRDSALFSAIKELFDAGKEVAVKYSAEQGEVLQLQPAE